MPSYRVITGLQYKGKEAVAGDIVSDVPQADIGWLVEQGHIEKVAASKKAKADKARQKMVAKGGGDLDSITAAILSRWED